MFDQFLILGIEKVKAAGQYFETELADKLTDIVGKTTQLEAIDIIDKGGLQIALVCDEEGRLLGAITDGDIRRSILKRVSLEAPVSSAMNKSPTFVRVGAKAIEIQKNYLENLNVYNQSVIQYNYYINQ